MCAAVEGTAASNQSFMKDNIVFCSSTAILQNLVRLAQYLKHPVHHSNFLQNHNLEYNKNVVQLSRGTLSISDISVEYLLFHLLFICNTK